jgi:hypothetical protein
MGMQTPPMAPVLYAGVAQQERHNVENVDSAGATPAVGTNFSASGGVYTRESQKLVGESPCRCEPCLVDQFSDAQCAYSEQDTMPV